MNTTQRKVLVAVAVAVLGMLLYPPYQAYFLGKLSETGYAWIFDLPDRATVNIATLILQWIGIAIVGGIAFFLASETDGPRPLVKKMPPPLTDEGASIREVVPSESIAVNDAGLESVSSSSDSPKITKRSGLRILIYLIAVFVGVRVFGIIGGVSLIAMYAVWHALQNKGAEIRYSGVAGVLLVGIFIYLGTTAYFSKVSGEASDLGKDLNGLAEGGSAEATTAQSQQPSDVLANPPAQTQSDSVKPSSEDVIQAKYESDLTKMVPDWKQINVRKDFLAWLEEPDPTTGRKRFDVLLEAHEARNASAVAAVFTEFKAKLNGQPSISFEQYRHAQVDSSESQDSHMDPVLSQLHEIAKGDMGVPKTNYAALDAAGKEYVATIAKIGSDASVASQSSATGMDRIPTGLFWGSQSGVDQMSIARIADAGNLARYHLRRERGASCIVDMDATLITSIDGEKTLLGTGQCKVVFVSRGDGFISKQIGECTNHGYGCDFSGAYQPADK